jgi:hypothetical protein
MRNVNININMAESNPRWMLLVSPLGPCRFDRGCSLSQRPTCSECRLVCTLATHTHTQKQNIPKQTYDK